jgi:hypothetical protein
VDHFGRAGLSELICRESAYFSDESHAVFPGFLQVSQ